MKIAYLILAHKNIAQLYTLINVLDHKDSFFFIHIDKKYKVKIKKKYLRKANVLFLSDRLNVTWAGYSVVKATLMIMKSAVNFDIKCDYFVLLSGQCFPIKSNFEIFEFFNKNKGSLFLNYCKLPDNSQIDGGMPKIEFYWYFDQLKCLNKYLRKYVHKMIHVVSKFFNFRRKYIPGLQPYFGSQWWALPRDAIEYIIKFVQLNSLFWKFYKYTFAPDEMFFQTIICNSYMKSMVNNRLFRFLDWDTNGPPKILTMADFDHLKNSYQLFARKFDMNQDKGIIDAMIDRTKENNSTNILTRK